MVLSDEHLMARIRRRDGDALEILVVRYEDMLRTHILRTVRDATAADDLVQEVFLRLWTRADQWQGRGALSGWLFRIATHLALNHLRTVQRRREQALEQPAPDADTPTPPWMIDPAAQSPEAELEHQETRRLIHQVLDTLPEDKRAVFRLIYEAEMSIRAAAETLGIPEGTVKSRLHYAVKHIAREWKEIMNDWEDIP